MMTITLKGKGLTKCITPAYLYVVDTMAMTEKQPERLKICENNWKKRRTVGVKRIDKRRMEELREEFGARKSLTWKMVRSRLMWTRRGKNGSVKIVEESGCAWGGG